MHPAGGPRPPHVTGDDGDGDDGDGPSTSDALIYLRRETKNSRGGNNFLSNSQILLFIFFFFPRFPPQNPNLQPAVVAVGDLGHLRGDTRHLKVINLEDPTPWNVDVGGLGDVDDGIGLGARDVVEIGFISAVEAGLEKESK